MNQYLIGLSVFSIIIIAVILLYNKFGKNIKIKYTNNVYSKAFVTSCGVVLIIFAIFGYELNNLIRLANTTFKNGQTIFAIGVYIITAIDICFSHAIPHYSTSRNTYKHKLEDNLFFIETTLYMTLLPIYFCTYFKFFIVLNGYHPITNFITVMWYSIFNVAIAAVIVWLLYNGIQKLLRNRHFHNFVRKINNITN